MEMPKQRYTKAMVKKTYKQLQTELDEVLAKLQSAELEIDEAVGLYKQGQSLLVALEDYLQNAKNEIEHLKKK